MTDRRGPMLSLRPMLRTLHRVGARRVLGSVLWLAPMGSLACAPTGPGPQQASFPPGQRVARADRVALTLTEARYDLRGVELRVTFANEGSEAVVIEREGILLAYGELEFPVSIPDAAIASVKPQTVVEPGASVELSLAFVTEQAMVEAGTLHVQSIRRGDRAGEATTGDPSQRPSDGWVSPLRLAVPPPAAFVEAASEAQAETAR